MPKAIPGVPEKISRAAYTSLIAATGIDPGSVKSLKFLADGIHAVVFARDEKGAKVIDPLVGAVKHVIYIPVENTDGASPEPPEAAMHAAAWAIHDALGHDFGMRNGLRISNAARAAVEAVAPHMLAGAFDAGFTACAHEHMKQGKDPSHPITRVNPYGATQ